MNVTVMHCIILKGIVMNNSYKQCLHDSKTTSRKLCSRGYCTAKHKFKVYPSAYANGYAVQVCNGKNPDYDGKTLSQNIKSRKIVSNGLKKWFQEDWVNVCEKGNGPGGFKPCGRRKANLDKTNYPYCRPYHKTRHTKLVTAKELSAREIQMMCKKKRMNAQGVDGKPTRVVLPKKIRKRVEQTGGGNIKIPKAVRDAAKLGLQLHQRGFMGGTQTGWNRAKQLSGATIDLKSLADMRTWFARHGPDAKNGGTSYQGYLKWVNMGKTKSFQTPSSQKKKHRGAVSWLIWGGDPAYLWLKQPNIRHVLFKAFPKRKQATKSNNLK